MANKGLLVVLWAVYVIVHLVAAHHDHDHTHSHDDGHHHSHDHGHGHQESAYADSVPEGYQNIDPNQFYAFHELPREALKQLERRPGATPPHPQIDYTPERPHPDIQGVAGPSPAFGNPNAPVKVFVWSDFQCPNCARVVEPLKYLARKFPDDVLVVFRHNPLPTHKKAAVAAARQKRFWEFHDLLFSNMNKLDREYLLDYAHRLGLNTAKFEEDMNSESVKQQILYDKNFANLLGLTGTPGLMVNGQSQVGWSSYDHIEMMVKRELNAPEKRTTCNHQGHPC